MEQKITKGLWITRDLEIFIDGNYKPGDKKNLFEGIQCIRAVPDDYNPGGLCKTDCHDCLFEKNIIKQNCKDGKNIIASHVCDERDQKSYFTTEWEDNCPVEVKKYKPGKWTQYKI